MNKPSGTIQGLGPRESKNHSQLQFRHTDWRGTAFPSPSLHNPSNEGRCTRDPGLTGANPETRHPLKVMGAIHNDFQVIEHVRAVQPIINVAKMHGISFGDLCPFKLEQREPIKLSHLINCEGISFGTPDRRKDSGRYRTKNLKMEIDLRKKGFIIRKCQNITMK